MKTSRLEQAIFTLNARQMASEPDSHIGAIDPRALLVVTAIYLLAMLSVPVISLGMLIWFAVYPIISAPLAHIAYERLFIKSLYVLPLLVVIGIFNPIFDHETAFMAGNIAISCGWISFLSIIIRGLLSVQAVLLLIYVAGFNRMCEGLLLLKVPRLLVTQLLMVYRYLEVLLQEALSMHRARQARAYGKQSYGPRMWGSFVGQLMLRTFARAERIHRAMLARGFNGSLTWSRNARWSTPDTVYCTVWLIVFALLRYVDFSSWLLKLLTPMSI